MKKQKKEITNDVQRIGSAHITKPGDNIFLDLGFSPEVAKKLRLDSEKRIMDKIKKSTTKKSG